MANTRNPSPENPKFKASLSDSAKSPSQITTIIVLGVTQACETSTWEAEAGGSASSSTT